ncbi:MAG: 3-keto-disaccharide hydrolase [Polyangiales bacterium]
MKALAWKSRLPSCCLLGWLSVGGGCKEGAQPAQPTASDSSVHAVESGVVTDSSTDSAADVTVAVDSAVEVAGDAEEETALPFRREDWEIAIGQWSFENGEATCTCKATSSLLYWKKEKPKDFDASVEVMFLTDESSAGIIFRERGEDFYEDAEFYQFEWYTRGTHHDKRLSLMRKNPYWVQIVTPTTPEAPLKTWISMRVRAVGDHLETFVDDKLAFEKHDATFVRTGKIGLHVFQPRPIRMRNWRLRVL